MTAKAAAKMHHASCDWQCGSQCLRLGDRPYFMGILNVTPDSFSDGGQYTELDAALMQAQRLVAEGADMIDVGGESTRPNSEPVSVQEELSRVIPVIEMLHGHIKIPISVDTTKSEVARQAVAAGASIINDISGLTFDAAMPHVCAESGAGVVAMHIQGTPKTMQQHPHYDNVIEEVRDFLARRLEELQAAGIRREALVIDPGIGFGKTAQHNVELLSAIPRLRDLGRPVLIGHSRKRFLSKVLGKPVEEKSFGTVGVSLAAIALGADILRLHDVSPSRDCWLAWKTVMEGRLAETLQP